MHALCVCCPGMFSSVHFYSLIASLYSIDSAPVMGVDFPSLSLSSSSYNTTPTVLHNVFLSVQSSPLSSVID